MTILPQAMGCAIIDEGTNGILYAINFEDRNALVINADGTLTIEDFSNLLIKSADKMVDILNAMLETIPQMLEQVLGMKK